MIFTATQTIGTVKFINGSFNVGPVQGVFASGLTLQYTTNGTTWLTSTWTVSPAYSYTNTAALQTFSFTGAPISSVKGVRVVDKLSTSASASKRARVREVFAYAAQNARRADGQINFASWATRSHHRSSHAQYPAKPMHFG